MLTFNEFLVNFNEEVEETFEQTEMSENGKIAVITVMRRYLQNRRYNPLELMELLERACYHAMGMDPVNMAELRANVRNSAKNHLTPEFDYTHFPDITFEETEKRTIGR